MNKIQFCLDSTGECFEVMDIHISEGKVHAISVITDKGGDRFLSNEGQLFKVAQFEDRIKIIKLNI